MGRAFEERNSASRDRVRAIAMRLSNTELARPIDGAWSAAGLLAHVAFWDRFVRERWRLVGRSGTQTPVAIDDEALDLVNDAALPQWVAVPPREAAEMCVAEANEVDRFVASLDDDVVAKVLEEGRERLVDRSLHRAEHLATIEAAFPAG